MKLGSENEVMTMASQRLQDVVRAIQQLAPEEQQALATWLQGNHGALTQLGIDFEAMHGPPSGSRGTPFATGFLGQPGSNDGNADSEPTSDAQERR